MWNPIPRFRRWAARKLDPQPARFAVVDVEGAGVDHFGHITLVNSTLGLQSTCRMNIKGRLLVDIHEGDWLVHAERLS